MGHALVATPGAELLHGTYPTPVERLDTLSTSHTTLWVKRDDLTHPVYGGNKVRKLEKILAAARARGKRRLVTIGAAGSHHVLACAVHGARAGFAVEAVLIPQRRTEHVVENLRADLACGATLGPVRWQAAVPLAVLVRVKSDTCVIPMGGSTVTGTMGYVDAARELAAQVRAGVMPEPDWIVVTVGSGGTAAGLAAGLALEGMTSRVLGVMVASPRPVVGAMTRYLARAAYRRAGGSNPRAVRGRLVLTGRYLGRGYGEATSAGDRAIERARDVGLGLDDTYTAKTFAAALDLIDSGNGTVLYWHTLSSAPKAPLLEGAPEESALGASLERLLRAPA